MEPLITLQPEQRTSGGRTYDQFRPTGPEFEHRGHPKLVQLLVPCDLSVLDDCLQRLPQDKKRMGFRLNVDMEHWMLKPSGRWCSARISRKDGKRLGWEPSDFLVSDQGICLGIYANGITFYREAHKAPELPYSIRVAQALARFCQRLNADPSGIVDYGDNATTHCMCCGKALTVEQSKVRGVGPECVAVLDAFWGSDRSLSEIEQPELVVANG